MPMDDDGDLMSVPMVQSVFNIDREALRREEQRQLEHLGIFIQLLLCSAIVYDTRRVADWS